MVGTPGVGNRESGVGKAFRGSRLPTPEAGAGEAEGGAWASASRLPVRPGEFARWGTATPQASEANGGNE